MSWGGIFGGRCHNLVFLVGVKGLSGSGGVPVKCLEKSLRVAGSVSAPNAWARAGTLDVENGGGSVDWKVISMSSSSSFESLPWGCSTVLLLEFSLFFLRRYFHFWTVALLPNAYKYRSASIAFNLDPSGSSNATEREETEL